MRNNTVKFQVKSSRRVASEVEILDVFLARVDVPYTRHFFCVRCTPDMNLEGLLYVYLVWVVVLFGFEVARVHTHAHARARVREVWVR